jgi:hypothetical protein
VSAIPYQSGNFDPIRPDKDTWVCYDYSINYARENPEWGVVTISDNPCFYGISHCVNWKISNNNLILYDSQYDIKNEFPIDNVCLIECNNWFKPAYYKFWSIDKTPLRNYIRLQENSEAYLNV